MPFAPSRSLPPHRRSPPRPSAPYATSAAPGASWSKVGDWFGEPDVDLQATSLVGRSCWVPITFSNHWSEQMILDGHMTRHRELVVGDVASNAQDYDFTGTFQMVRQSR